MTGKLAIMALLALAVSACTIETGGPSELYRPRPSATSTPSVDPAAVMRTLEPHAGPVGTITLKPGQCITFQGGKAKRESQTIPTVVPADVLCNQDAALIIGPGLWLDRASLEDNRPACRREDLVQGGPGALAADVYTCIKIQSAMLMIYARHRDWGGIALTYRALKR
ncbi:hypothetical protein ACIBHX_23630 [Nonomuraea sp. NPDC050536]|uniref:hypothetical protein n=1 Tax=Nonomuraea sp. NPDC050536 TaxID=3364366 RepID=UPI0037C882F0